MSLQETTQDARAEKMLPKEQFSRTEFVFDCFDGKWAGRTDIECSILAAAVFPNPSDKTIERYKPFMVRTEPLGDLRIRGSAHLARPVIFADVGKSADPIMIAAVLTHANGVPIAHIGHAVGLPLWTNGGDIKVLWDTGPRGLFLWGK